MAQRTNIEWTKTVNDDGSVNSGFNWNFLRGCQRVSPGCVNCYAEKIAGRFSGFDKNGKKLPYFGLATMKNGVARWTGKVSFHEDILHTPLRMIASTSFFVDSMSDLFYEEVPDQWIDRAMAIMHLTPRHTYQLLTKRPERMRDYFNRLTVERVHSAANEILPKISRRAFLRARDASDWREFPLRLPLNNLWVGVSCENQETADQRIPVLLDTRAALRWISAEPLLERLDVTQYLYTRYLHGGTYHQSARLDWIVAGGESGTGARPTDVDALRWLVYQAKLAKVPIFVKQMGSRPFESENPSFGKNLLIDQGAKISLSISDIKGGKLIDFPLDIQLRQFPETTHLKAAA